jgi:hypothetical protein
MMPKAAGICEDMCSDLFEFVYSRLVWRIWSFGQGCVTSRTEVQLHDTALHSYRLRIQGVGSLGPWLARRIGNIQQDAYISLAI